MRRSMIAVAAALIAGSAQAATEISSVTADAHGNAVLRTAGGAKIIVVGEGARLAAAFEEPVIVETGRTCRTVGTFVRGRSYMYGVSSGDPVPTFTKRICE